MKKYLIVLALLSLVACTTTIHPPSADPTINLSAQGKAAYNATKVIKALDVFRDVTIAAYRQGLISKQNAQLITIYHQSSVKTINAVPDGWRTIVDSGLTELAKQVPADQWKQVKPFADLIKTVLALTTGDNHGQSERGEVDQHRADLVTGHYRGYQVAACGREWSGTHG